MRLFLRRGTEKVLAKLDAVLLENEIICTIPDEYKSTRDYEILKQPIFKYKLGNGKDKWCDLPYQEGTIPVIVTGIPVETRLSKNEVEKKSIFKRILSIFKP